MKGYGYFTSQSGGGVFNSLMNIITSPTVRDAGSEALKSAAKSGGIKPFPTVSKKT